jgi:hypothetical protein
VVAKTATLAPAGVVVVRGEGDGPTLIHGGTRAEFELAAYVSALPLCLRLTASCLASSSLPLIRCPEPVCQTTQASSHCPPCFVKQTARSHPPPTVIS